VRWVAPLAGNEQAVNLNLAFESRRKHALHAARNKKNITISKVIQLVQGGKGFLVYVPIFIKEQFQGFILGVFRVNNLLEPILEESFSKNYHLSIAEKQETIFMTKNIQYQHHNTFSHKIKFDYKDMNWVATFWPKSHLVETLTSNLPNIVLLTGLFISIILSLVMHILSVLKSNEHKIKEKSDELEFLNQGTELISEAPNFDAALQSCITLVCRKIHWKVGHAYVLGEPPVEELIPSDIWYIEKNMDATDFCNITRETTFKPGIGLPGRIWASKQPAWIKNVQTDPNFPRAQKCTNLQLKGAVGFPILVRQQVVAVLEFFHTEPIEPNKNLLKILRMLGEQIGSLWEKRKAENLLKFSEKKNSTIIETAMDPIILINKHGIIQECNSATAKTFKYEISDLIGKNISCLMKPPEKNEHNQYIQRYLTTGKSKVIGVGKGLDVTGVDSQNQPVHLHLTINQILIKNEVHFVGILRDITVEEDACFISNKLIHAISKPFLIGNHNISIGISIGIAYYPTSSKEASTLVQYADKALYVAKKKGRNQYQIFQAPIDKQNKN